MDNQDTNKIQQGSGAAGAVSASTPSTTAPAAPGQAPFAGRGGAAGGRPDFRKNPRRPSPREREPRAKPEYDQKTLSIRRVTRVASGGRRFSFSVALVAGNRRGMVGVGTGKASDTALAMDKALRSAKKNMVRLNLDKNLSIPHDVEAKYSSAVVSIRPNKTRGLVAGSSVRAVLELGGVKNVTAKLWSGSKNRLNIARAAMKALSNFSGTVNAKPAASSAAAPVATK